MFLFPSRGYVSEWSVNILITSPGPDARVLLQQKSFDLVGMPIRICCTNLPEELYNITICHVIFIVVNIEYVTVKEEVNPFCVKLPLKSF